MFEDGLYRFLLAESESGVKNVLKITTRPPEAIYKNEHPSFFILDNMVISLILDHFWAILEPWPRIWSNKLSEESANVINELSRYENGVVDKKLVS